MNTLSTYLTSHGFDLGRLKYAIRTALAACVALVVAYAIGLEHPQWAAMTVWATSQPTRGHLLEKCLFRALGTIVGTIVGIILILLMGVHPTLLIIGLAVWVSACTFVGNTQRGFIAYACLLSAYTAALVSLLDTAHPDHIYLLGADRLATVLLGVIVSGLGAYFFARRTSLQLHQQQTLKLLSEIIDYTLSIKTDDTQSVKPALLTRLANAESQIDQFAAGSPARHRQAHALRRLLIASVPLILELENNAQHSYSPHSLDALKAAAHDLRNGEIKLAIVNLNIVYEQRAPQNQQSICIADLVDALVTVERIESDPTDNEKHKIKLYQTSLHKEWKGAVEAALRVGICLSFFGSIWLLTGWTTLGFMLLGMAVMLSVFSNSESPAQFMRFVLIGQVLGVLAALTTRWIFWPFASNEWTLILLMMPAIFIGAILTGNNKTVKCSFDYNMVSLLLLQPINGLSVTFTTSLAQGAAVVSAPIIAMLAYYFLFPINPHRKITSIMNAMLKELQQMATDKSAISRRLTWQARLYHRTLLLVRQADLSPKHRGTILDLSIGLLNVERAVMSAHRLIEECKTSTSTQRAMKQVLLRCEHLNSNPVAFMRALQCAQNRAPREDSNLFEGALNGMQKIMQFKSGFD